MQKINSHIRYDKSKYLYLQGNNLNTTHIIVSFVGNKMEVLEAGFLEDKKSYRIMYND